MAYNSNVLPATSSESGNQSNNNIYQGPTEKNLSADNIADGFGIARPATLKTDMETFPGSEASEQSKLKMREMGRFDELKSKTFKSVQITNEGISLDSFGGNFAQDKGRYGDAGKGEQAANNPGRSSN